MKVKAIVKCTGPGYENFNVGEVRNLKKSLAEKLIEFRYAKQETKKQDGQEDSEESKDEEEADQEETMEL